MSQTNQAGPPSSPIVAANGLAGYNCSNCGRFVKFKKCQSNTNGNQGRLLATCHLTNERGESCQFFRWAPGSSKSPSASPPALSTPTLPPFSVIPIAGPTPSKCSIQGCGQTRIADDCLRRICRKHCIERGGCTAKKHKAEAVLGLSLPPPPLSFDAAATAVPPLLAAEPALLRPQPIPMAGMAVTIPTNISSQPLDTRPNPRFASHLLPIYVESLAREQTLELAKAKLDAERIASAKQTAQKVTVHTWRPGATDPESRQIQKGFTWPFFTLSPAILSLIGLQESADSGGLQMYDEMDEYWLTVDVDHVMEVREGQRLFLRDRSVRNCQGFDDLFKQVSRPHLRNNLSQERAYVRNAWKAFSPHGGSSSPQKRKATSPPPDPFPSPDKRERTLPTAFQGISPSPISTSTSDTATAPAGSLNSPIELSDSEEKKWPRDYYVSDIALCFRDAKTYVRGRNARTAAVIFHEHFPHLQFISSTFSDNKAIWRKAPQILKSRYLIIGRREAGLWSKFAVEVKNLENAKASSSNVIELTESE